jgi:sulfur-carrier protein adenylyltransferase/sulfurtransferase
MTDTGQRDPIVDVPEITPAELKRRIDTGDPPALLDVREPKEWPIANLAAYGAELIPLGELQDRLDELDPSRERVVYCRSGKRSRTAVAQLRAAGFEHVWNLEGGLLAWSDAVDSSIRKY